MITKSLDDVMTAHPDLDLPTHDFYDPQAIATADDDLMKFVHNPPIFPLLDNLRFSYRLMIVEEMLSSTVDEDHHHLTEQGIKSSFHPESLGLVLASQPISVLANLSAEFEEMSCLTMRETELAEEEEVGTSTEVALQIQIA